ncbi:argininosuccinate synthase domain-containing protein [Saccharopolyspora hordei]|uniref:argininosuccinate synthase n=1 Tax=Saccharopolyspora hordei TaxID=1838 RepID=A0A853AMP7_9PSEU|nr:argininosuccinate synthase domain-containing protein [Saccharopolyspora hordei]NYI85405.1 argininosuccinate synthase [Saccharopolyspora hordei]
MSERVVLAYSGDPDASAAVARLAADAEVVAVTVDLGQGGENLAAVRRRALESGATEALVVDARDEFAEQHCLPALQAHALQAGRCPLVAELARPLVARHLVVAAERFGADAAAHGCAGDDTLAADLAALAPHLTVLAPVRDRRAGTGAARCALRQNVWGRVAEPGVPRDLWRAPDWPLDPEELTITFDRGVPVALDGETVTVRQALQELNRRAGAHGVGHQDGPGAHCATPGATTLTAAHQALEELTLARDLAGFKRTVGHRWRGLVLDGTWSSPLRDALDAFVADAQQQVSGEVRVVLHAGRVAVRDRRAEEPWRAADLPAWYDSSERGPHRPCGRARAATLARH